MTTNKLLDNRYQIINKLGETNLSITFEGKDTKNFNRPCLIKQLKSSHNLQLQKQLEQRFQQEAKVLERLGKHPQIPDLYGYFSENNQFYLVQEWIAGCNLKQKLDKQGKLTEIETKDILIKLLPVLEFLQENQIVHRDIKPSNIMLNSHNLPILIDFGIIKEICTIVNPNRPYTVLDIGTQGFISPEQKKGLPIYASDIYSLGVTAIYLLTGKLPNDGLSWRKDVPNISPEFANILDKAIEKNCSDRSNKVRYKTATEMLTELNKSQPLPVTTPSPDHSPPPHPKLQNSKLLVVEIVVIIISIIVGIFSEVTDIFTNFNKAKNQSQITKIDKPEIKAKEKLNTAFQKAESAMTKAKVAQKKEELEIARNELKIVIKELETFPKSQEIHNQVQAKKREYMKVISKVNQGLTKQPCYELLWKTNDCQEYPVKLDDGSFN